MNCINIHSFQIISPRAKHENNTTQRRKYSLTIMMLSSFKIHNKHTQKLFKSKMVGIGKVNETSTTFRSQQL